MLTTQTPLELKEIDSYEKRKERAEELSKRFFAWEEHMSEIGQRWEMQERLVRNDPDKPTDAFWSGYEYRHIPVTSAKARAWQSYVCSSPTQANPYLVGTIFGTDATRASEIEQDFYLFMRKAHWDRTFRMAALNCGMYGKAIWRVTPYMHDDKPCFQFDAIRPRTVFAYPNIDTGIETMLNFGHQFEMRVEEIQAKQISGEYYNDEEPQPESEKKSNTEAQGLIDERNTIATRDEDKPSRVVETFDRHDYGEGEHWYIVHFCPDTKQLKAVYDYPYSRPWYFDMWVHEEQGKFWPETSRLNDIQGLQLATNEAWNLMSAGSQMAAFQTVFATGWALPQKYARTKPGAVVPIQQGGQVFTTQNKFDPSVTPLLMNDLDKRTDLMMRIGAQSQGGEASYDKTATGAQIRKLSTDVAINDDIASMDVCLSQIGEFMQEIYRKHHGVFLNAYGGSLAVQNPSILEEIILWELNGKSPANTPQAQAEAAMALTQSLTLFNPQTIQILMMAGINWQELMRTQVKNSTLDNKQKILTQDNVNPLPPVSPDNSGLLTGMDPNAGMGMVPSGMPQEVAVSGASTQGPGPGYGQNSNGTYSG